MEISGSMYSIRMRFSHLRRLKNAAFWTCLLCQTCNFPSKDHIVMRYEQQCQRKNRCSTNVNTQIKAAVFFQGELVALLYNEKQTDPINFAKMAQHET
jgi:hypothetical protein